MNKTFGLHFNVFLQTSTDIYCNYQVKSVYGELYATFAPGTNNIQPQWSYFIFGNREMVFTLPYVYVGSLGQGTGFNASEIETITNALMNVDGYSGCYCIDSYFRSAVQSLLNIASNIICQSDQPTYSYFKVNNDRWLSIKPRYCYYTIWDN